MFGLKKKNKHNELKHEHKWGDSVPVVNHYGFTALRECLLCGHGQKLSTGSPPILDWDNGSPSGWYDCDIEDFKRYKSIYRSAFDMNDRLNEAIEKHKEIKQF